ncbi:hypothetical protein D3C72_1314050 [compost metagenome]
MPRPPDHAGQEGGDDGQQADAGPDPQGQGRLGGGGDRQKHAGRGGDNHGAHGHEMQPADAQRRQNGGDDHPLGADPPGQQSDGADQQHSADDRRYDQGSVPRQDGAGQAQCRHAEEVHRRDAKAAGQGGDQAAQATDIRQGQVHGDVEGDDDDG